jgi:hypothetical protein
VRPVLDSILNEWVVGFGVPILVSLGIGMLADEFKEYKAARWCFWVSAVWLWGKILMWSIFSSEVFLIRAVSVFLVCGVVGIGLMESLRLTSKRERLTAPIQITENSKAGTPATAQAIATPSLVFVFGAPLGDNDSASWIMMLKHYGQGSAYNCDVIFYDDDRKNIEHEWLVKHPKSPYPPPGLVGESQKHINIPEAGPEGSVGSFKWNPLDPNSQHYTVSISCRDGVFIEKWEVTRVNGILRSAVTIEHGPQWIQKNPGKQSMVFRYQDPEFVRTSVATEMPKVSKGKVVHPGWKPQHRFEVPAAIIDPNGNIQIVSGIKLPDGSTLTDFGSWNILTRHFGDTQDSSKQP